MTSTGKALQQELFQKKLWFRALKKRGEQQEEAAQQNTPPTAPPPPPPPPPPAALPSAGLSSSALASRLCFPAPSTPAPRASSPAWDAIAAAFAANGVCLLSGGGSASTAAVAAAASVRAEAAEALRRSLAELRVAASAAGLGAEDSRLKSRELVRRSPGRYDLTVDLHAPPPPPPPSSTERDMGTIFRDLRRDAPWQPLLRRLLGASCYLMHCGCVLSLPGAATQGIHRDGKHIFLETEADAAYGEDDANDDDVDRIRRAGAISSWSSSSPLSSSSSVQYSKLPAHCITVFVPLVDLCGGGGGNGPTEFWPGTHHTTADEPSPLASSVTFTDQDDDDEENVEGEDEGEGRSTANGAAGSGGIDIDIDVDDDDDVAPVVIAGGSSSSSSSSSSSGVDIDDVDDDIPATNVSSEPPPPSCPCPPNAAAKAGRRYHAKAGDAIIFDYRILHRGLANGSPDDRPLAYFTYGRQWFRDATNYTATSILS
jgi:hypothetical protein